MARGRIGKALLSAAAIGSLSFGQPAGVPEQAFPDPHPNPGNPSPGGPGNPGPGGPGADVEQQPANTDGRYQTYVGGYYSGTGISAVRDSSVSIQATVTTDDGGKGTFSAPSLLLTGDHFGGIGTAVGTSVRLTGRIDGYNQDKHFQGARILVFYTDAAGRHGRIAGVIVP